MRPPPNEVTQLLLAWSRGQAEALEKLIPLVYDELRRLAHRYLDRGGGGQTLQATALVHEAYLKLVDQRPVHWQNRAHFFAIAAQAMRQILVNRAIRRQAAKRGGGYTLALEDAADLSTERAVDVLALDEALKRLAVMDPQKSRLVELRFFGGLSIAETAAVLGLSPATVKRAWSSAKAWLYQELNQ